MRTRAIVLCASLLLASPVVWLHFGANAAEVKHILVFNKTEATDIVAIYTRPSSTKDGAWSSDLLQEARKVPARDAIILTLKGDECFVDVRLLTNHGSAPIKPNVNACGDEGYVNLVN